MRDRKQVYLEIWSRIENLYFDGYMAYEHTLQAELYAELRNTLPDVHVIAEPTWNVGKPDLAIVEKGQITDIFELKIWNGDLQDDIRKLLLYGANNETYRVGVNPNTADWAELPVWHGCRLHSVVVAWHENKAVWPESVRGWVRVLKDNDLKLRMNTRMLSHWFGRVGGNTDERRKWSIEFGIR